MNITKVRFGWIEIQVQAEKIVAIKFTDCAKNVDKPNEITKRCRKQLEEYCSGNRIIFELPIDLKGTEFQQKVWEELCKIPYGKTITYKEIAQKVGNEKAVRAVGTAIGKNPIAIVIPCHRVIGSNGSMTGYAYGINKKEKLLKLEKRRIGKFCA